MKMEKGAPGILAILAKGSKEESPKKSSDMKKYAQELIDAIKSEDADAVSTAFSDMAECFAEEGYPEDDEEMEDESEME